MVSVVGARLEQGWGKVGAWLGHGRVNDLWLLGASLGQAQAWGKVGARLRQGLCKVATISCEMILYGSMLRSCPNHAQNLPQIFFYFLFRQKHLTICYVQFFRIYSYLKQFLVFHCWNLILTIYTKNELSSWMNQCMFQTLFNNWIHFNHDSE